MDDSNWMRGSLSDSSSFQSEKTDPLPEKETIEVTATPVPSETEEPEQEEDVKEIVFEDEGMDEVMSSQKKRSCRMKSLH